ncbi:MAG: N-acetylmuramoyl-L-alanine amidase [Pseudanabaenaceae cyanobacterium bins.39]|nr:N-acetylmuramoyl-L-alanine amidase [Pseudanabaenaceae cyanobacterium bins.39]
MQRLIRRWLSLVVMGLLSLVVALAIHAQTPQNLQTFVPPSQLHLTYPPLQHTTVSDRLFFIGTAPRSGQVSINGQVIKRSEMGHFAPSLPLQLGENKFLIKYVSDGEPPLEQKIEVKVDRQSPITQPPSEFGFIPDSLFPQVNMARLPDERICFEAIATPKATVTVKIGGEQVPLLPRRRNVQLPANSAVLTGENRAIEASPSGYFRGCASLPSKSQSQNTDFGQPEYTLRMGDRQISMKAKGTVTILAPQQIQVAEVKQVADARTGPSTDFSRLTPLPEGTQDLITGKQGEWLRLAYGGWVRDRFVNISSAEAVPRSLVRGISTNTTNNLKTQETWTEIKIPLEVPVPISISQGDRFLSFTLHNTTAQTDTIAIAPDSIISKLDWQQIEPHKVLYTVQLKPKQQWGYKVRYQNTNLIISLKHPPQLSTQDPERPLQGARILIDAGHGSAADLGARGPTGYPEKDVTLTTSQLLQQELQNRGAKVMMTRTDDADIELAPRVAKILQEDPTLAISIHYNALPDDGDALNTSGMGAFWYNPQAEGFAKFLNTYVSQKLNRPDYGVYWANLAVIRPTNTPSVLLELGFMINPVEFEWIIDPQQQQLLGKAIADGITAWMINANS